MVQPVRGKRFSLLRTSAKPIPRPTQAANSGRFLKQAKSMPARNRTKYGHFLLIVPQRTIFVFSSIHPRPYSPHCSGPEYQHSYSRKRTLPVYGIWCAIAQPLPP